MKILVTGASGFIGKFLLSALRDAGHEVRVASRSRVEQEGIEYIVAPGLGLDADWSKALLGVDAVVHLAGRAHVTSEKAASHKEETYYRINAEGTRALAKQAAAAGLKHFVFLSSCHAVAAESESQITEDTQPYPATAYGRSKLQAEMAVAQELVGTGCEWTILRPPLVYGAGNQANFALLLKLVKTGIPLPLASVSNRRSFIYVENLVDLIVACIGNLKAYGKTYLPSDDEDVSTPELIRKIAQASFQISASSKEEKAEMLKSGKLKCAAAARLFPFPESILKAAGRVPELGALRKLAASLYVDSEPIRRDLGWTPPFSIEEGLRRTLAKYKR